MIPNILRIETENEIITLLIAEPGKLIEMDRIARPLEVEPPSRSKKEEAKATEQNAKQANDQNRVDVSSNIPSISLPK